MTYSDFVSLKSGDIVYYYNAPWVVAVIYADGYVTIRDENSEPMETAECHYSELKLYKLY